MNTSYLLVIILLLTAVAVVVLFLILSLFRKRKTQLREEIDQSGETILIEPNVALYQGGNSFVSLKTFGVVVLTDRRVIFRKPVGADIEVMLSHITNVRESEWFRGNRRAGKRFLVLESDRGLEIAFVVRNPDHWIRVITARLSRR